MAKRGLSYFGFGSNQVCNTLKTKELSNCPPPPQKLIKLLLTIIVLTISFVCLGEENEPGQLNINMSSPGFSPSMTYQNFGNGESVNTASGGLIVVHNSSNSLPQNMGASLNFTRVYNSKDAGDAYKDEGSAPDEVYPNWGFLGPGWKLSFGRVFLRILKNSTNQNVSVYFYEDENGTEYRLYPAIDDATNADPKIFDDDNWDYGSLNSDKYPYTNKYYRTEDGSFIYALFKNSANGINQSYWTIFFPDGSKKICGGSNAFVMPLRSEYNPFCKNTKTNGWYCTEIIDKAGNIITINYRNRENQPYAGSIETITDQFNRTISFNIWTDDQPNTSGEFYKNGLLKEIVYPDGSIEQFSYSSLKQYCSNVKSVMLETVTDSVGLQTKYGYQEWSSSSNLERAYLNKIYYPTGGVSEFVYEHEDEVVTNQNGVTTVRPKGDVVKQRIVYIGANTSVWNWDRSFNIGPQLDNEGPLDVGFPVVVEDPYGIKEVHCFKGSDIYDCGAEYYVMRLKPGNSPTADLIMYPETNGVPKSDISFIQKKYWKVIDGNPKDGIFIKKVVEKDASYSNTNPIVKTTRRANYDGWGHFSESYIYEGEGDNLPASYKKIVVNYNNWHPVYGSVNDDLTYNLTLLTLITKGGMNTYKYEGRSYNNNGLLTEVSEYLSETSQGGNYRSTQVDYDGSGNPTQITYYKNDGTIFTQNLTWSWGVVASLNWAGFSYYEFTRFIDSLTGRITSETDANGLTTDFSYDAIGRIIQITPPNGEAPTKIEYPLATKTRDEDDVSVSWAIGNVIKFYKGSGITIPEDKPLDRPDGKVNWGSDRDQDIYTYYEFDDLGRLIRTSNVMPDNSWSSTDKCYDPLGNVVFESYPYTPGINNGMGTTSISIPVGTGSSYSIIVPTKNSTAYGVFSTPFNNGLFPSPFSGALDPFLRTRYVLKPDGGKTENVYLGLETDVTIYGIQTGPTTQTNATTKYYKDIFGRLISVVPPEGASATYTYNGLDQLISAQIGSQPARTFSYDAMGHLLTSFTPERGTINYAYDALGNLTGMTDAKGIVIKNSYDSKGRIHAISSTQAGYLKVLAEFSYDEIGPNGIQQNGNLTTAISYGSPLDPALPGVVEQYIYNGINRRLGKKIIANLGKTLIVEYTYDDFGNIVHEKRGLGHGYADIDYSYNHGYLKSGYFVDGNISKGAKNIVYYPTGAIKEICFDSDCTKKITYDLDLENNIPRLNRIKYGDVWDSGDYNYDKAGNITQIGNDSFYYDSIFRLKRAEVENALPGLPSIPKYAFDYVYDSFGNMYQRNVSYLQGETQDMKSVCQFIATYDLSNRITSYTPFGSSAKQISYDSNGNQTKFGDQTFLYDELNRLKSVVEESAFYYYDTKDERVARLHIPTFTSGESGYYLKEGAKTLGEVQYIREDMDTTSIREKYYLYIGGNILTSSEKEYSISISRLEMPPVPDQNQELGMTRCVGIYAEKQGLSSIVKLSDALTFSSKGQKYNLSYTLENITDDLAGVIVRLARIKDQGSSGNSGDNGNGCPRKDEDKVQLYYFLREGMDADFVFNRFGLCENQNYGQITTLETGQVYPIIFSDLQKDKKYKITLYAITKWQADENLGYNLIKVEEGSVTVPKKEPSNYFQIKSELKDEITTHKAKIKGKWGSFNGASVYNLYGKNGKGEKVFLGSYSATQNEAEIDIETAESLGVSQNSDFQLEAVGAVPNDPIIIGPIKGGLVPVCPAPHPPLQFTTPVIKRAYLFDGDDDEDGITNVVYLEWDKGCRPAPKYSIYKKVLSLGDEPPETLEGFDLVGETEENYFVMEVDDDYDQEALYYSVQPTNENGESVGFNSIPIWVDYPCVDLLVENGSTGNGERKAEVNWMLEYYNGFDTNSLAEGSGFFFKLYKSELPMWPQGGGGEGENGNEVPCRDSCGCFTDYSLLGEFTGFSYTDTVVPQEWENPIFSYKLSLWYNNGEVEKKVMDSWKPVKRNPPGWWCWGGEGECDCNYTNLWYCYQPPEISGLSAIWTGTNYNDNPVLKLNFLVNPTNPLYGDEGTSLYHYLYYIYLDGNLWWAIDESDLYSEIETENGIFVTMHTLLVGSAGEVHTLTIKAIEPNTGCSASESVTVQIPPYTVECPETSTIKAKAINLGDVTNEEGTFSEIEIVWSNAIGNSIKIFKSTTGYEDDYTLVCDPIPLGDSSQGSYTLLVPKDITIYFKVETDVEINETTTCTLCRSAYLEVTTHTTSTQEGATYRFFVRDHLGNSRAVLDTQGNLISQFNFEPYGVELLPLGNNGEGENPYEKYKYTDQERDYSTGLDYMHFRFYASSMGRFLKPDNIIPNAFNPQSWNLYSYVNGNPVNFNDPIGHFGRAGNISPAYMFNVSSADWINWGAMGSFYSNLYGGNVAFAGGGSGGGGSATQTYTVEYGKWILAGFIDISITENESPYAMIVCGGNKAIWNFVTYSVQGEITMVEGENIPYQVLSQTRIIGHLGIWEKIGQRQIGAGYGKYDISIDINVYKLTGIRTVFMLGGKIGIALEPQFFSIEDYRLYETSDEKEMFENRVNPYKLNYLRLPKEPLGMPLTLDSVFERWLIQWPLQ